MQLLPKIHLRDGHFEKNWEQFLICQYSVVGLVRATDKEREMREIRHMAACMATNVVDQAWHFGEVLSVIFAFA